MAGILSAGGSLGASAPAGSVATAAGSGAAALAALGPADSTATGNLQPAGTITPIGVMAPADSVASGLLSAVPTPPAPAPTTGGGLLPGVLGGGMGPYKRPGQVFGEQDPLSPYLTARAGGAPLPPVAVQLTLPEIATPAEVVGLSESDLLILLLADHL
jgi:hypothetical protein